ncbi:aldehyde dehydrogenase family protein [Dactylosporangium sp. NPDC051484]|uniref:aldehyde dehydrogenase family protein n=1 Tax=Dactylosporangium sp. NPDC051484 TaxID=3154942 RepID=UPI00344F1692
MNLQQDAYRTINPSTGELVQEFPAYDDQTAEAALARAHEVYAGWRETTVEHRVELFRRVADAVAERRDELADKVTEEMGKTQFFARAEVDSFVEIFRYYADHASELLADEEAKAAGFTSLITRREPMGVTLAIEPWNGPLGQAARAAAPNLMLGNTIIVKPAEICPGSSLLLDRLFVESGFPEGAYQTALLTFDQVSAYLADPRVRAVTLTGSHRAGTRIAEQAGRHIKPVVLELGGSDAFIVLSSADVSQAAQTAALCRLLISGQVCTSPKRIIVEEPVAGEFIDTFVEAFRTHQVGDPQDPATVVGPMASEKAAELLQEQYDDAVAKGATVLVPGGRLPGAGFFFAPAVLTDITPEMRLYSEEAFGPLAIIYRVSDEDAAVASANSSMFGLGGTVYAEDLDQAHRVARRLDTGGVGINRILGAPIEIPFGGTKASGLGRELGRSGMDQFANIKTYGVA